MPVIITIVVIALISVFCYRADHTQEAIAKREACETPSTEVVATRDGVTLYRYKGSCYDSHPVYFSSAGTQTTHTEHQGKNHTVTVDDIVPNGVAP